MLQSNARPNATYIPFQGWEISSEDTSRRRILVSAGLHRPRGVPVILTYYHTVETMKCRISELITCENITSGRVDAH